MSYEYFIIDNNIINGVPKKLLFKFLRIVLRIDFLGAKPSLEITYFTHSLIAKKFRTELI